MVEGSKFTILTPEFGVRIAWKLAGIYSENVEEKDSAKAARHDIELVVKGVTRETEKKYNQEAMSLIDSSLRSMQVAVSGRNLNFKEADKLRKQSQDNIAHFSQFSANLQSTIPRIGSMTLVGAGSGLTLNEMLMKVLPTLGDSLLPLILALGAGIGYLAHGLVVVPVVKRMLQLQEVGTDYDRNLYFDQYVQRSRDILLDLYYALANTYRDNFGREYTEGKTPTQIIDSILAGIKPTMCKYVNKHMQEGKINSDLWAMCETGQGM